MNLPDYVSCCCQHCGGGIEFDANELGEENSVAPCPHCRLETKLVIDRQRLLSTFGEKPQAGVTVPGEGTPLSAIPRLPFDSPQDATSKKRSGSMLARLTEVSIRATTKSGDTPLHRAAKAGKIYEIPRHLLCTELFLVRNYDWQKKPHRTPLHVAAMYGHLDQVPLDFLTKETLTVLDKYGRAPLHEAAASGHANKIPPVLLTPEFLSMRETLFGNTILHYLAWCDGLSLVANLRLPPELLNLPNFEGETSQQIVLKVRRALICGGFSTRIRDPLAAIRDEIDSYGSDDSLMKRAMFHFDFYGPRTSREATPEEFAKAWALAKSRMSDKSAEEPHPAEICRAINELFPGFIL